MRRATPAGRHDARIDTGKRARCSNGFERRGLFSAPASRSDPPAVDALERERSLRPDFGRRCREHRAGASRGSCSALGIPLRRLGPRVRHAATASAWRAALQSRVAHAQEATSNRASTPSLNRPPLATSAPLVVRAARAPQCEAMEERDVEPLLRAVAGAAESLPEVQAAFLFGSQASGRSRSDSDVDVAILLDPASARRDPRTRLRRAVEALAARIAADRLDVVVLNDAPPALAFQVLKRGRLAFERDRSALHRFRVRTYAQHSDFEPTERFFSAVTRKRALTGARHG